MFAKYRIKEPFWNKNAVGLAERDMTSDVLAVEILYKDKDGKRKWPRCMYISKALAMACPPMKIKENGPVVRIVPIEYLQYEVPK